MKRPTVLFLIVLGLAAGSAFAVGQTAVLGSNGDAYLLKVGAYGKLFPGGSAARAEDNVLALEVHMPDQPVETLFVPASDDILRKDSAYLFFENASDTVYIFWEGRIGSHPILRLESFRSETGWSPVIDISDNPWSFQGGPQLLITRDQFVTDNADGSARIVQRSILHIVWWEETGLGDRALYTSVTMLDGTFQGKGPVRRLDDLLTDTPPSETPAASALVQHPAIQAGVDGHSVVITFADQNRGKLATVDVEVLPAQLGLLADLLRRHVLEVGPRFTGPDGLESLADDIRAHIIIGGARLNPRDIQTIADEVRAHVLDVGPDLFPGDLESLADDIRAHIIIGGARLTRETLDQVSGNSTSGIIVEQTPQLAAETAAASEPDAPSLVHLSPIATFEPPVVPDDAETWVYTSSDGRRIVVGWLAGPQSLRYQETTAAGTWTPVRSLELGSTLSLDDAVELLRKRVR